MKEKVEKKSRAVLKSALGFGIFAALMFGPAGTLAWPEAWVFLGLFTGVSAYAYLYMRRHDPGLLEERQSAGRKENVKVWDQVIISFYSLLLLALMVLAGLDAVRFHWSRISLPLKIVGFLGMVPPAWFAIGVIRENSFLSERARIQSERGHKVCTTGPYRFVRHPMYLGVIFLFLFMPLALGSFFAWIPAGLIIGLFVLRTALEDAMLRRELPGYKEYADKVRFRLIPGVW